jgi:hypothetical protein
MWNERAGAVGTAPAGCVPRAHWPSPRPRVLAICERPLAPGGRSGPVRAHPRGVVPARAGRRPRHAPRWRGVVECDRESLRRGARARAHRALRDASGGRGVAPQVTRRCVLDSAPVKVGRWERPVDRDGLGGRCSRRIPRRIHRAYVSRPERVRWRCGGVACGDGTARDHGRRRRAALEGIDEPGRSRSRMDRRPGRGDPRRRPRRAAPDTPSPTTRQAGRARRGPSDGSERAARPARADMDPASHRPAPRALRPVDASARRSGAQETVDRGGAAEIARVLRVAALPLHRRIPARLADRRTRSPGTVAS